MQKDKTVDNLIQANRFSSRLPEWLIVGISFVSIIAGLVVLVSSTSSGPAVVNLSVALAAFIVSLLNTRRKPRRSPLAVLFLIAVITIIGLFSSLLFRDDYSGGSCGEFDWPSGHLHAGYPNSWLDGHICFPPNTPLSMFAQQHPEEAEWHLDFPALFIGLLFWFNIGILVSSVFGRATVLRSQMKRHNEEIVR